MTLIVSLLDNDLYKFTMQQAVLHQFPETKVEYEFKCRNKEDVNLTSIRHDIRQEIDRLASLRIPKVEQDYLRTLPFIKDSYVDFLKYFRLDPQNHITLSKDNGQLHINIKGNWLDTILYEVPVLAIVSELYSNKCNPDNIKIGIKNLTNKVKLVKDTTIKFADFGTRRRYSQEFQEGVVKILKQELPMNFIGTSNVDLARRYDLRPIGTMAHEWIMAGQGMECKTSLKYSQRYMLQTWANEYRGQLGIALSDTLGFDAFLKDFDLYFAKLFDGCRHDSGDPYTWGYKLLDYYLQNNIPSENKSLVFSDGLNFQKMRDIYAKFGSRADVSFGVGTNLTNDCGVTPLQIVIKMTKCNGRPVAKISDSLGKQMCNDKKYLQYLASRFDIPKERIEE